MYAYEKVNAIFAFNVFSFSVFDLPIFSHKTHNWDFIFKDISLKTKLQKTLKMALKPLKNWSFLIKKKHNLAMKLNFLQFYFIYCILIKYLLINF